MARGVPDQNISHRASIAPRSQAMADVPRGCQVMASDGGHWATRHCQSHAYLLFQAGVTEELQLEGTGLTKDQEGSPVSTEDDRRETTAEGREVRPHEGLNKYGGPR